MTGSLPRPALLLLLLLCAACAAPRGSGPPSDAPITREEMEQIPATTVLDAVRRLRPQWINRIDGAFLDGQPVSPAQLRREPVRAIAEIRLLSAEQATARYGTRSLSGGFLEITRRRE